MKAVLLGGSTSPSNSASSYASPNHGLSAGGAAAGFRAIPSPAAFKVTRLYVVLASAPGTGTSYTVNLLKNGSTTAVAVPVADTATSASLSADVVFSRGDTIEVRIDPAGTPTSPANVKWYMEVSAYKFFPVLGTVQGTQPTTAQYFGVSGTAGAYDATEYNASQVCPISGTLSNFQLAVTGTGTTGKSLTYVLYKNGVATAATLTVADNATTASDVLSRVAVSPGDRLSWLYTPSDSSPPARTPRIGMRFDPTTDGKSCFMYGSGGTTSTSAVNYGQIDGNTGASWAATESNRSLPMPTGYTFTDMYVNLGTAPGAGKTMTLALRNAGATSALAAAITGTNTTGVVNGASVAPGSDGALFALINTPSGTPATVTGGVHLGLAMTGPTTPASKGIPIAMMV